jgi:hypothetical protein
MPERERLGEGAGPKGSGPETGAWDGMEETIWT